MDLNNNVSVTLTGKDVSMSSSFAKVARTYATSEKQITDAFLKASATKVNAFQRAQSQMTNAYNSEASKRALAEQKEINKVERMKEAALLRQYRDQQKLTDEINKEAAKRASILEKENNKSLLASKRHTDVVKSQLTSVQLLMTGIFYSIFLSAQQTMRSIVRFMATSIEELRANILQSAALITSQQKGDPTVNFKNALAYSKELNKQFVLWNGESLTNLQQMQNINRELNKAGVVIDYNNAKHKEGVITLNNAIYALTAGMPNMNMQVQQEIRSLLEGNARQGSTLAIFLKRQLGESWKEIIREWIKGGTFFENMTEQLKGFKEAIPEIQKLATTQLSTIQSQLQSMFLAAGTPLYDSFVSALRKISSYLEKNKVTISENVRAGFAVMLDFFKWVVDHKEEIIFSLGAIFTVFNPVKGIAGILASSVALDMLKKKLSENLREEKKNNLNSILEQNKKLSNYKELNKLISEQKDNLNVLKKTEEALSKTPNSSAGDKLRAPLIAQLEQTQGQIDKTGKAIDTFVATYGTKVTTSMPKLEPSTDDAKDDRKYNAFTRFKQVYEQYVAERALNMQRELSAQERLQFLNKTNAELGNTLDDPQKAELRKIYDELHLQNVKDTNASLQSMIDLNKQVEESYSTWMTTIAEGFRSTVEEMMTTWIDFNASAYETGGQFWDAMAKKMTSTIASLIATQVAMWSIANMIVPGLSSIVSSVMGAVGVGYAGSGAEVFMKRLIPDSYKQISTGPVQGPGFANGTDWVAQSGRAVIHQGEAVVPRYMNQAISQGKATYGNNTETNDLLRTMISKLDEGKNISLDFGDKVVSVLTRKIDRMSLKQSEGLI